MLYEIRFVHVISSFGTSSIRVKLILFDQDLSRFPVSLHNILNGIKNTQRISGAGKEQTDNIN